MKAALMIDDDDMNQSVNESKWMIDFLLSTILVPFSNKKPLQYYKRQVLTLILTIFLRLSLPNHNDHSGCNRGNGAHPL